MKNSPNVVTKEILRYFCHPRGQSLYKIGQLRNGQFFSSINIESKSNRIEWFLPLVN
jgi:hypothetical protein